VKALAALLLAGLAPAQTWIAHSSGVNASLRGVSAVNAQVVWASGTAGTVLVTTNGGTTWRAMPVPDAGQLDFRDVEAFDDRIAYLLASGPGEKSRIYKTSDGGRNWTLQFTNPDSKGFFDAFAFWDARHGMLLGDPVDGEFVILTTGDGGTHWQRQHGPPALPKEGAFAASGTSLIVQGKNECWFATGGEGAARVFRSADRGRAWMAAATPVRNDATAGIFSLAFRGQRHGIAAGGDYAKPGETARNLAITSDGGRTWHEPRGTHPAGYRSAIVFSASRGEWIAVGPSGSDISTDDGENWKAIDRGAFNALSVARDGSLWAVGPDGRIAELH